MKAIIYKKATFYKNKQRCSSNKPSQVLQDNLEYDIGKVLDDANISSISAHEKYKIPKKHFKPDFSFSFPKKIMLKCNRSCKVEYLKHELIFIKSNESVFFCISCAFFAKQKPVFSQKVA